VTLPGRWITRGLFVAVAAHLVALGVLGAGNGSVLRGSAVVGWSIAAALDVRLYLASRGAHGPALVTLWLLVFSLVSAASLAIVATERGAEPGHLAIASAVLFGPVVARQRTDSPLVWLLPAPSWTVVALSAGSVIVAARFGAPRLVECAVAFAFALTALEHWPDGGTGHVATACPHGAAHEAPQ